MTIKSNAMGAGTAASQANALIGGVVNGLTATGSTQATALLLSKTSNAVVTTTAASTGVILPPGNGSGDSLAAGDWVRVYNYGANALTVYPPVGGKLANGTLNAGVSIAATKAAEFLCIDGLNFGVNASA